MRNEKTIGQTINEIPNGKFVTLVKIKPMGALQVRKQSSGVVGFFWRYSLGAASERVSIGLYDSAAAPKSLTATSKGHSFAAAVRAAELLALEHYEHRDEGGRPALLEAKRSAKAAQEEIRLQAARYTLSRLLDDYCDNLQALGRSSHSDARSIFNLHVKEAWPKLAALPAKDVSSDQFADMMRKLIEAGKGRTANKLRAYARAAYQMAKSAKAKPSIPVEFKSYGISVNPVADTEPDESSNKPNKRPLSTQELRAYWVAIEGVGGFRGALLRFHLLTGGQRIEQLVNLLTANISNDGILIHDKKGRPGRPARPHLIPLTAAAAAALADCMPVGTFALSTDGGETHVAATTLSEWAVDAAGHLIQGFQAKRIRSGVETILASAKVSQDIRGRLQSHGVAGVQARHYDGHDYVDEKRESLETLYRLLTGPDGGKANSSTPRRNV